VTIPHIKKKKGKREKIVAVTAYDYPMGRLVDEAGVDIVLVGDSLGMVVLGYETTLPVSMEEMLYHTRAVARGVKRSLLVGDMPFLSFQISPSEAVKNAGEFLRAGAEAVKVEGGEEALPVVAELVKWGIPVMGHIGLTPQKIHAFGGYRLRGKGEEERERLLRDARRLEDAGCFSLVLENIPASLARQITESIGIPTIGIGAGPFCDGQILVLYDLLGLNPVHIPRFVKVYAEGWKYFSDAVMRYAEEVRNGSFPTPDHYSDVPLEIEQKGK
ncbi:MAG: 3-methyl-2-oxobutanoate hydroxymethyltransferase, partial [bacterium]